MTTTTKLDLLQESVEAIQYHNHLYFNLNNPEISDAEFDALVIETVDLLDELDEDNDITAMAREVLDNVGAMPSYGKKVTHSEVMGSLSKVNNIIDLVKWRNKFKLNNIVLMPKIDGLAIELTYQKGKFVQAVTRGNGTVGQDVTDNVMNIKSVPKIIKYKNTVRFRGEIYMKRSVFNDIKNDGLREYKNPRNTASGLLGTKNPKDTGKRQLDFYCYDVREVDFDDEIQKKKWVKENAEYIKYVPIHSNSTFDQAGIEEYIQKWTDKRSELDYDIDGLVFSVLDTSIQDDAGYTGKCPKAKIAFKFPTEQKTTTIIDIVWQVGRTGKLTPVSILEPVDLANTTVTRCTLHNWANIRDKDICIGDEVLMEKAGDIIPQIVRVTNKGKSRNPINKPSSCPCCDSILVLDDRDINIWCENPECSAQLVSTISNYVKSLEIMNVGSKTISNLMEHDMIKCVADLYRLSVEKIEVLEGYGKRSAKQIVEAPYKKSEVPLNIFLQALGISNLGKTTSKDLAKEFKTLKAVRGSSESDLMALNDIGPITAKSIVEGLKRYSDIIDDLIKYITVEDVVIKTGCLTGKSFCITGSMPSGIKRKDLAAKIEDLGGTVKGSVGKGLGYLVQADVESESSKTKKAKKFGTEIISEDDLYEMMK